MSPESTVCERQFLFQCRVEDIDVRSNRKWKYKETFCISCDNKFQEETQMHILECNALVSANDIISYIPTYNDIFSSDVDGQVYTSNMIRENMRIRALLPT